MKTLYKVLDKGLTSPYRDFKWKSGKDYHCSDFDDSPDNHCSNGFYAVPIEGVINHWRPGRSIWECKTWGREVIIDSTKQRFENMRLTKRVYKPDLKELSNDLDWNLYESIYPINPLKGTRYTVTALHKEYLIEWASVGSSVGSSVWASVWASVWDSVWASVRASVWDSVWASVGDSVRDSVWASVWDSVWAYVSSLFPGIKIWKYIDHKSGVNPFQPCIDLWRAGFVPSFDGKTWRLHSGKSAEIVYEYTPRGK